MPNGIMVGTAYGVLELNISQWKQNIAEAKRELASATADFNSKLHSAGMSMTNTGKVLTARLTTPIVLFGKSCVDISSSFTAAMSKVSALSGATGEDLEALADKAKEMGAATKYTATESAEALQYMALAGWGTEEMLVGLEPILKLAGAAAMDLGRASDIVTDGLTAFGMTAADAGHFADVLAVAMSKSNTDVEQLGEAFRYIGPLAGSMKYSIEDVSLALGIMANSGIKASQGGTALRATLLNLIQPTDKQKAAMQDLGIQLYNMDGSARPLRDVLEDLRARFQGLTEEEKANYSATLAGAVGMSGFSAIVNASEEEWNTLANSIDSANGAAMGMYDTMTNNLQGSMIQLSSAFEALKLELGEMLTPVIQQVTIILQNLVQWLLSLDEGTKQNIITIAAIVAAIGPLLIIVGKVVTVLSSVTKALGVVKTAILAINAPIAAIVSAIGVLVAAFMTLWNTNEEFRAAVTAIWERVKATFESLYNGIKSRLNGLKEAFTNIINFLKPLWDGFCSTLAPVFEGAFRLIANTFEAISNTILGLLDIFIGVFTGDWGRAWEGVKSLFQSAWNWIVNLFNGLVNTMTGIGRSIFNGLWNGLKSVWNSIVSWLNGAVNWISEKLSWINPMNWFNGNSSGHHAAGLPNVPYDGYRAVLHKGERVLTAEENEAYSSKAPVGGGNTYNFYSPKAIDVAQAKRMLDSTTRQQSLGLDLG